MPIRFSRRTVSFVALFAILLSPLAGSAVAPREPVALRVLSISDWHAQLDPLNVLGVGNVGGAAALAAYFAQERAINPNTLLFTAGDAYGASPPLASYFHEEPAVLAMNAMGFNADTFGNHNFDRGLTHLQQMIGLATFPYLSANLKHVDGNLTGVKPYSIFEVGGVKVAAIGITNPEAPSLVTPGNFGTIEVTDPVAAAQKARAAARREGARVFIVLAHLGVTGFDAVTGAAYGPLIDFANAVGGFDLILGDHTDVQYQGVHNNALVVENQSKGLTYARVQLSVDPQNGRVISRSATFVTPLVSAVTPDPAIVQLLSPYRTQLAALLDQKIGTATGLFPRNGISERLQEVAVGNVLADAIRSQYGTQLAFTNSGGIRAPLPSSYAPADTTLRRTSAGYAAGPPYDLVAGDTLAMLPFGNVVVTRTVTGAQLHAMLENSVSALPAANGRFAQISGFKFTYSLSAAIGSRVLSVTLADGPPILADNTTYTLATNDFLNEGGDSYSMLADGSGVTREVMADVLMQYIQSLGVITPIIESRITQLP